MARSVGDKFLYHSLTHCRGTELAAKDCQLRRRSPAFAGTSLRYRLRCARCSWMSEFRQRALTEGEGKSGSYPHFRKRTADVMTPVYGGGGKDKLRVASCLERPSVAEQRHPSSGEQEDQ